MSFELQVIIEYAEKSGAKPVCGLPKGSELPIGLNGVGGSRISGKPKLSLHGQVDFEEMVLFDVFTLTATLS